MNTARAMYDQQVGELKHRLGSGVETAEREYEEAVVALRRQQAEQVAATQREHGAAAETVRQQQAEEMAALRREHEATMEALRRQQAEEMLAAQSQQHQALTSLQAQNVRAEESSLPTSLHDDVLLTLDRLSSLLKELEYGGLGQQMGTMRAEIEARLKELEPLSEKEEPIPQWLTSSPTPSPAAVPTEDPPLPVESEPPVAVEEAPVVEEAPPTPEPFTPQQLDDIKGEMEDLLWGSFPEIPKLTRAAMADVNARYARARELLGHVADPVFQAKIDRATRLLGYLTKKQDAAMMGRLKLYPDFHDFIDTAPEGGESTLQWVQAHSVLDWMERARQSFGQAKQAMGEGNVGYAADLLAVAFALSRMVEHTLVYLWQQYLPEESYSLEELDAFQAEVQRTGRQSR
ncbi:MAG: hypothetical protein H0T73_08940 [Ardenticatenales bacterium]|nr:hypothetical protein [Ardenticatenales bacterium]